MTEETQGNNIPATPDAPAAGVPAVQITEKAPDIVAVGKKNLSAIYIHGKDGKAGSVVELSDKEAVVLRSFLRTYSYEETAKEAGIETESVKRMLRRPNLKAYLEAVISKAAVMEGVDTAWAVKELVSVWEGTNKPSAVQMEAMKQIGKILAPKGPGVVVNAQQNSYYAGMGKDVINAEWTDARATAAD